MTESLLRFVTSRTVVGQFRRMAHGDAKLTPFSFSYEPPGNPPLDFAVDPKSPIPSNIHVLIGRNGVGKTHLLNNLTQAVLGDDEQCRGTFRLSERGNNGSFANLISVSFSAFDDLKVPPDRKSEIDEIGFSFIGLRRSNGELKPKEELVKEFISSLNECQVGTRKKRWEHMIERLQSDPVFRAAQLESMFSHDSSEGKANIENIFGRLSSGHKIVLLTLTRLIEKVEERSLVLIDEPEAHLHPPLLSAMTRALSDLMAMRNGVAIIATHSPVVLQEVPKSCVWILRRILTEANAERPAIETFAENIDTLSREVFQLELVQSGYHHILARLRAQENSYEDAIEEIEGHLGAEGRAVLRAMYLDNTENS